MTITDIAELRRLEAEAVGDGDRMGEANYALFIAMRNALPELLKALEWQPIETAPKDGTEVLGIREGSSATTTRYHVGKWNCADWDEDDYIACTWEPTHWMPLPLPPHGGVDVG